MQEKSYRVLDSKPSGSSNVDTHTAGDLESCGCVLLHGRVDGPGRVCGCIVQGRGGKGSEREGRREKVDYKERKKDE